MDATDFVIGSVLIGLLVWTSIIAVNLAALNASINGLQALIALNKPLISAKELCEKKTGFKLVSPNTIEEEPYHVLAGTTDSNQTFFCFYRKTG